eukprot:620440-Alexandrium_andersonii.AAC.1
MAGSGRRGRTTRPISAACVALRRPSSETQAFRQRHAAAWSSERPAQPLETSQSRVGAERPRA